MVGLRISCIPYNGPHRPEVSYLSPTCVMQPASQRDATQHELRSHACTQLRGQKPRTDTTVPCFSMQDERGDTMAKRQPSNEIQLEISTIYHL